MTDEFDRDKARRAREEGLASVLGHNPRWIDCYYAYVQRVIPCGTVLSAEDIRRRAAPVIGEPTHPNGWGAASNGAYRRGLLSKTGKMVTPKAKKSHARAIQQYVRTDRVA
jgi:hypothetical protein